MKRSSFCYLNRVSSNSDICPKYQAHSQQPIRVSPWQWFFAEPPERWKLAHVGCSEPAYNGIYPDGRLSRPTAYTSFHPGGNSSKSILKDRGSPMSDVRSQLIIRYTLTAYTSFTLTATKMPPLFISRHFFVNQCETCNVKATICTSMQNTLIFNSNELNIFWSAKFTRKYPCNNIRFCTHY